MDGLILPLLLMLVVALPLILSTRKQKKLMAEQQEMQNSLSEGDRVMTTSGLYATIVDTSDETTIDLEIAEGMVTTWLRQAVREKIVPSTDLETDSDLEDSTEDSVADSMEETDTVEDGVKTAQVAPPLEHGKK